MPEPQQLLAVVDGALPGAAIRFDGPDDESQPLIGYRASYDQVFIDGIMNPVSVRPLQALGWSAEVIEEGSLYSEPSAQYVLLMVSSTADPTTVQEQVLLARYPDEVEADPAAGIPRHWAWDASRLLQLDSPGSTALLRAGRSWEQVLAELVRTGRRLHGTVPLQPVPSPLGAVSREKD